MKFSEYMNKYYGNVQPDTDVWLRYKQIWGAAEQDDYLASMENYCEVVRSVYQKKRDKLKKQTTHMTGKFMIVKVENNTLRTKMLALITKYEALAKKNKELEGYMVKSEIEKYVKVMTDETGMKLSPRERPTTFKKVPFQC